MAKLDDVTTAMVAKYGITTARAQDLLALSGASEYGVFKEVYPEKSPGDQFWNKVNTLIAGMPYEPKT
jgi:hypothetical protein